MKKQIIAADLLVDLAGEILRRGGLFQFYSRGFSMIPDIGDRERVTLGQVSFCDVKIGDVLLCTTDSSPVLHRVIHKSDFSGETILILGSDTGNQIHRVRITDVIGKVVDVKRSKWRLIRRHLSTAVHAAILTLETRSFKVKPLRPYKTHKLYI